jgi:hypothetical protein
MTTSKSSTERGYGSGRTPFDREHGHPAMAEEQQREPSASPVNIGSDRAEGHVSGYSPDNPTQFGTLPNGVLERAEFNAERANHPANQHLRGRFADNPSVKVKPPIHEPNTSPNE